MDGEPDPRERPDLAEARAALRRLAQHRAELMARLVASSDAARRRTERDLHDGPQQHLVSLALRVALLAQSADVPGPIRADLQEISGGLDAVMAELREIAQAVHPATLSDAGLEAALGSLVRRSAVPVRLRVDVANRLPAPVEAGAYHIVAETLANAAERARADDVEVSVALDGDVLRIGIAGNGIDGAVKGWGTGLRDRAEALGGQLRVDNPARSGTRIRCEIPARPAGWP